MTIADREAAHEAVIAAALGLTVKQLRRRHQAYRAGKAAQRSGRAHRWTSETAAAAHARRTPYGAAVARDRAALGGAADVDVDDAAAS